jgi:hypothetical protein
MMIASTTGAALAFGRAMLLCLGLTSPLILRDNVNISDPFILVDLQCLLNIVSRLPRSSIFGAPLSTQCPSNPPISLSPDALIPRSPFLVSNHGMEGSGKPIRHSGRFRGHFATLSRTCLRLFPDCLHSHAHL